MRSKRGWKTLFLAAAFAASCPRLSMADWKITTQFTTNGGSASTTTEYFKDSLIRSDWRGGSQDSYRYEQIDDPTALQYILLNPPTKEFVVRRPHYVGRFSPMTATRRVIFEDIEAKDTGERRAFFGRTARHVITDQRTHSERQFGATSRTLHIDGWYIDATTMSPSKRAVHGHILFGNEPPPEIKVNRSGPREDGFAVWEKKTLDSVVGRRVETLTEVTELYEGTLEPELFRPPADYHRVIQFSGERRLGWPEFLQLEWEWIEDSIRGLI